MVDKKKKKVKQTCGKTTIQGFVDCLPPCFRVASC